MRNKYLLVLSEGNTDLYEGVIRSPLIVTWKNKIKERTSTDHSSALYDLMPTMTGNHPARDSYTY